MRFLDVDHPFFLPLWRRIAITAFCAVWAGVEWSIGASFWSVLMTGILAWAVWSLLYAFDPERAARRGKRRDV